MFFDLQRFGTTTSNKWTTLKELDETHYSENNTSGNSFWGFVPAGTTYTEGEQVSYGIGSSSGTTRLYVFDKSDVSLIINNAAARINDRILGTSPEQHGIAGNATAISVSLNNGKTVSDLVVEGANKEALKITINGTVYNVYYDGSVDTMAPYGFLLRTDKRALDKLGSDTTQMKLDIIDLNVAVQTAVAGGEMTADGFVLKNNVGLGVATIQTAGLDAETAAATYATKEEMREYVRQVIASDTGCTFINGSGTTVAQIPIMQ